VLFPPGTPKAAVKPPDWMAKKDREAVDWYGGQRVKEKEKGKDTESHEGPQGG